MVEARLIKDDWISEYVRYTERQESPKLFHQWTAIAVLAGALRRNVWMDRGYFALYPNLYIVLVAPSGRCRKSTAAKIGVDLLRQVKGMRILHEKITPEGLISYLSGGEVIKMAIDPKKNINGNKDIKELKPIEGIDPELLKKAAEAVLRDPKKIEPREGYAQHCNAFIYAPELSVFLGNQTYTSGLVELLTSLYEGKDEWEYTTKTSGQTKLTNVNINVFGASNPEWLAKGLSEDSFGGGFMGRTIYVFQDQGKKVAWPQVTDEQTASRITLMTDLHKISKLNGEFKITKDGRDFFETWYNAYKGEQSGRLSGYYERKADHVLKIAMILSVSASSNMVVSEGEIGRAIVMLDEVEEMMPQAFAFIGATNEARVSQHVIEALKELGGVAEYKKLLSKVQHLVRNTREFNEMLTMLEETDRIQGITNENVKVYYLRERYARMIAEKEKEEQRKKEEEARRIEEEQKESEREELIKALSTDLTETKERKNAR